MPLPKITGSGVADITKEDEENNSLDTFIRQAIGKEPFLSFSRVNDSPVPWIQLLHALDQQDLPGWPLLSPLKIQMQKCEKCPREFCSTINYRRHLRLHRRNLNLDKDSTTKNRVLLQEFWDKLSVEKTMEIMSFEDVFLEGVTGHSIIKKLASFIRKPGFTSLPQSYIRAGSALLDIVQARPSRFPVSSQELFSILDDASEKTFLCAGTAESLQKYVFDGEAGKIGLEMRNSIACTSFLVEQKLVKACLADKDAEALRYQKLLVEEEEAAQKRQAAVLERKRQKKLKQKEQKVKEQVNSETFYPEDRSPSPPSSSLVFTPESDLEWSENPCSPVYTPDPAHIGNPEGCCGEEHETGYRDAVPSQNVEHRTYRSGRRHVNLRSQAPKLQKSVNGFHTSHNYQVVKLGPMQKHVSYRDSRTQSAVHGGKVWTPKTKTATDEESYGNRLQVQGDSLVCQDKKSEVLIGSISVTLRNQNGQKSDENLGRALETCASDHSVPIENGFHEKPNKIEAVPGIVSRSTGKLWRPVNLVENGGQFLVRNGNDTSEVNSSAEGQPGCRAENNSIAHEESPSSSVDGELEGGLKFSSQVAEAFLAKRWTEAIASDHVTLVLFPEANPPPGCPEVQDNNQATITSSSSKLEQSGIPVNHLTGNTTPKSSAISIPKMRPKLDKGSKVKYIPKQRSIT